MNVPEGLEEYVNDFKIHVFEIAWLSAMTGDARYANLLTNPNAKKGVHNMCDVAERLENKGRAEDRAEGQKAIIQNMLADHVPHDKIKQYTNATDAEIAEAEEEMLVK